MADVEVMRKAKNAVMRAHAAQKPALERRLANANLDVLRCTELLHRRSWKAHSERYKRRLTRRGHEAQRAAQYAAQALEAHRLQHAALAGDQ